MGVIRKLKDKELVGGTQDEEVYPVTSTQSVYNSQNKTLDQLLDLNLPINISANYSTNYFASVYAYSLQEAISAVPLYDRRIGFVGTFLSKDLTPNKWVTIQYNGVSVDSSAWINPDNWVQMLSELDIVQSSGESKDKVMSQKAVKEFVEGYSDSIVGGLNMETLSFNNIQALDGSSNVNTIKTALKIGSSKSIKSRLEELSKCTVVLTDGARDNFEDRIYVNLYKSRRSISSTSYAGVAMTYMGSDYIQTTFFYNPTPEEGDLDYSKIRREVCLLGEPSID
jgi:hypothetical protein